LKGWITNPVDQMMIAFSSVSTMQIRLPAGNDNTSSINLIVYIRDTFDGVTEFNVSSIVVGSDSEQINNLVDSLQTTGSGITNNPLVRILSSGNQNTVSQVISSLSQAFNKINSQTVENAVASKMIKCDLNYVLIPFYS
jgi:hypothetical protein